MSAMPGQPQEHWWEEIRPHFSVIALFMVFLLALAMQNRIIDSDFWWHLRTGQWIIENGRIPYTDPFSFTMQGQPWIAHSWLAEIFMYLLFHYVGPFTLPLLRSLLQVATFGLLLWMMWERWPRLGGISAILLLSFIASARFWLPRPNSVSLVLAPVFLYIWYQFKWHGRDSLWLLPVLMVLWANLHSGFIYGLFLLAALFFGEFLGRWGWPDPVPLEQKRWLRFGLFSLLCIPAALLNPYGFRLLFYPFTYYFGGITMHTDYVGEWLSPNFHEPSSILFALLLLGLLAVIAWRRVGMGPSEALAMILFTGLALSSVRAAGIAIPLLAWSLAGVAGQGIAPRTSQSRRGAWPQPGKVALWGWYGGTLLLVVLLLAGIGVEYAAYGRATGFADEAGCPAGAVAAIAPLPNSARIFNSYNWGGYLIWKLYPDRQVFIDGRADLYGDALFNDFMTVYEVKPDWSVVLDRYRVDTVICERQGALATLLMASQSWQSFYTDETAAIFRRVP